MCGQSGSGKTYSLGVLLERVLAETELPVVILDPNSDFVGLAHLRESADRMLSDRYARVAGEVSVWRNDSRGDHLLRLRFTDLDKATQAAVLQLDPITDREEYAALVDLVHTKVEGRPLIAGADELLGSGVPAARDLGLRALNLGVLGWQVWGPEMPSVVEALRDPTARCTVVDLGSLRTVQEQRLVAAAALSAMWDSRWSRTPCLLVMDEAHNICPAEPEDLLTGLSTRTAVQIAAEGRKYGLYLLASTQRPHKIHENVVSQCDNLLLMRMNSDADLADLSQFFSFVPKGLLAGVTTFRLGQALIAGPILPQAAYVHMGERVSQEGGADIPTTWAGAG
jgi:DNA helicase HerA-like ATPase